jgi:hypothetical protein
VIAAIVGAGVGGFVTLFGQWLTRRSEERRHIRQLVVQTAIENWRFTSDAAEKRFRLPCRSLSSRQVRTAHAEVI